MENTPVVFNDKRCTCSTTATTREQHHRRLHQGVYSTPWTWPPARRWRASARGTRSPARVEPDLHVFASEGTNRDWFEGIHHFSSHDLKAWKREARDRAGRRRAPVQHLGVPRRQGLRHGLRVGPAGEVLLQVRPLGRPRALGKAARPGLHRRQPPVRACPVLRWFAPWCYVVYLHARRSPATPATSRSSARSRARQLGTEPVQPDPRGRARQVSTTPTWTCSSGKEGPTSATRRATGDVGRGALRAPRRPAARVPRQPLPRRPRRQGNARAD